MACLAKPVNGVDPDEAPTHPAWKAKKWVAEITQRMYSRYGDPKLVPKDHIKFAQAFGKEFSLKMLILDKDDSQPQNATWAGVHERGGAHGAQRAGYR